MVRWDLAVAGSGFGGALLAAIARRRGLRTLMIERGRHPRFAIGESTTPLANLLLESLCRRHDLPRLTALTKWGSWQAALPDVVGGIKRGFTFFHHPLDPADSPSRVGPDLMVAASPHEVIADTHWLRSDVDQHFVREAISTGVDYFDSVEVESLTWTAPGVEIRGRRGPASFEASARFLVDATGPRGLLHQRLGLTNVGLPGLPDTGGLFNHFHGVERMDEWAEAAEGTSTTPFRADDSALHHLFPGGWIWVLRFANGIVSAGVAAERSVVQRFGLADGESGWRNLLDCLPAVRRQFARAKPLLHWRFVPTLSYRASRMVGPGWALLPSTAGFTDPLLSSGIALNLIGIERLVEVLAGPQGPNPAELASYAASTAADLFAAAAMIRALYPHFGDSDRFAAVGRIYFAAVSFAESARRLGRPDLAPGFLLNGRRGFWDPASNLLARAAVGQTTPAREFWNEGAAICAPIDIGNWFADPAKQWLGVDFQPLRARAGLFGATTEEIDAMLARSGARCGPAGAPPGLVGSPHYRPEGVLVRPSAP